jgi:hypothetical protein
VWCSTGRWASLHRDELYTCLVAQFSNLEAYRSRQTRTGMADRYAAALHNCANVEAYTSAGVAVQVSRLLLSCYRGSYLAVWALRFCNCHVLCL